MALNLSTVMDQIGVRLQTITGLRVYDFPPQSAQPPFAFVDLPDSLDYDLVAQRGNDRTTIKVYVAVSANVDREFRDRLAAYAAGSGAGSVKTAIEVGPVGTSVRVRSVSFGSMVVAGGTYMGAIFDVDVTQ